MRIEPVWGLYKDLDSVSNIGESVESPNYDEVSIAVSSFIHCITRIRPVKGACEVILFAALPFAITLRIQLQWMSPLLLTIRLKSCMYSLESELPIIPMNPLSSQVYPCVHLLTS